MSAPWYKQMVTSSDNRTYDGAYIALVFIVLLAGISVVSLIALASLDVIVNKKDFNPAGLGGGISAVLGGLAAFLAGVGAYILMDRKQPTAPTTTTTESQSTVVRTVAQTPILPPVDIEAAGRGVEPLSPEIRPQDVGSNVAIVKPTKGKS